MKYCCTNEERNGTCYHELIRGKYSEEHWAEDSLYLDDEYIDELGLLGLLEKVIPEYDRFGITEVTKEQWERLCVAAKETGGEATVVINEIEEWQKKNENKDFIYTILGI